MGKLRILRESGEDSLTLCMVWCRTIHDFERLGEVKIGDSGLYLCILAETRGG